MNEVKRRYAWIDLLKPETQAAVGVLAVLEPSLASRITSVLPVVGERVRGRRRLRRAPVLRGLRGAPGHRRRVVTADQLLGPNLSRGSAERQRSSQQQRGCHAAGRGTEPAGPAGRLGGPVDETLGAPQLIWERLTGWMTGVGKDEALRRALLDWLAGDKTFELEDRDPTFQEVTKGVGPEIGITVTGHTHLERAIDMGGNRFYFNCGTWIRLMRFTDAMLKDTASFKSDLRRAGRRPDEQHRRRDLQRPAAGPEPDERGVHQDRGRSESSASWLTSRAAGQSPAR